LSLDNQLVVVKTSKSKYLAVIDVEKEFITNEGKFSFSVIKNIPSKIYSSTGVEFKIYHPTYKEFVLLMKRGPQIIYPKDIGQIILEADIHKESNVLEIGTGSGALTLYLLNIIGTGGSLISLDVSRKNQRRAKKTIDRYMSTNDFKNNYNLDFITTSLVDFNYKEYTEVVDTVVTDVPEPWEFFENNIVTKDLKWVSYLPSISQITKFNDVLINNKFENIEVKEVILRDWVVDKKIVRPSNKLVSHTGFIISGRYIKY
jgi:tRNA (adenine57-N1/adenine58-N1)-methyltransferase|tara:strand:+ start:1017 stop:1793 length:777 start_codon:yes stop_codon:yes gene_type:complete